MNWIKCALTEEEYIRFQILEKKKYHQMNHKEWLEELKLKKKIVEYNECKN